LSFFHELKRRNVFRVGAAYVVASWLQIQVAETIFPLFGFGDTPHTGKKLDRMIMNEAGRTWLTDFTK